VFRPIDIVDLWFQSVSDMRPTVWARNGSFLGTTLLKVALVIGGASCIGFALADFVGAALSALLLIVAFHSRGKVVQMRGWKQSEMNALLRASWPLLLAGVAISVYMRIDQVMLPRLLHTNALQAVGNYSAAVKLSEVWYFIPMSLVTVLFPKIVQSKQAGSSIYLERLKKLFSLMTAIALVVAVPMTFLSNYVVTVIYGNRFSGAGAVLAIHIWTTLFVFWGVVGEAWFVNEGLTRLSLYRTLSAAGLNVGLNFVLIPSFGALGAAVATLIAQAFAAWILNIIDARTRPLFFLQLQSLVLRGLL
jgi:PST family polysaccharide transporter